MYLLSTVLEVEPELRCGNSTVETHFLECHVAAASTIQACLGTFAAYHTPSLLPVFLPASYHIKAKCSKNVFKNWSAAHSAVQLLCIKIKITRESGTGVLD